MAFNLFSAITSGMNAYNALSNTQTGQNMIGQVKQAIAPVTQPIQQEFNPAIETAKSAVAPVTNIMSSIAKPVVESTVFNKKTQDYYAPFKSEIEKIGITYDDLAELPEEEKQQVVSQLKQIGVQIPGLEEQEQAKAQKQAQQGKDLGIMGNIGEGIVGAFRSGEQIPRIAGAGMDYITQNVTGPLVAGGLDLIGADDLANRYRDATKIAGEGFRNLGEDITRAGEGDITEKQRTARRVGGEMALTAPIGGGYLAGAKGVGGLALRSGVVGTGFGAVQPIIDKGGQATVGDIATGGLVGGVTGAVAGPLVGLAGKGIVKGSEIIQRKINPSKFTKQIDDETINLVRKAVRPSITGVDSVGKFDIQDEKLLQGVKEVVKKGKKPKNSRELMEAISDTKKSIWAEVEKSNKAVVKKTNGSEISAKVKGIVNDPEYDELFANNPSLEAELLRFADDVVTNKRFQNLSQEKLQNYLVDINGRIPQTAFQKSLASNPTQTAKDTLIAKVYKDILDDNLEVAVGMAGKETRQAYGAVRQLEKDFAKRYGVYLRQNPQGLADMFGMEGFADMAVGLLTGSPSQVARGGIIQGVKKLIKVQNNPDTIIRDIFKLQGKLKNVKVPIVKKTQKLLPPPSQQAIIQESKKGLKDVKRPLSITPEQAQLAKQAQRQAQVKEVERELNTALKSNYNPNKPEATKAFIERNITQGKITREEAISMVENLYDKANGFDKPHYEKMLNDLYSNKKIESFDDLLNEKQVAKEVKTPRQEFLETPEGIYKEINKKANDRRYNPEKANILIEKFKEKTGIDLMKNPIQKFDEKGNVVKPNSTTNAKQPRNIVEPSTKSDSDIPEGYFKNAFGEIQKNPGFKKGGYIGPGTKKLPEVIKTGTTDDMLNSVKKLVNDKMDSTDIVNARQILSTLKNLYKKRGLDLTEITDLTKKIRNIEDDVYNQGTFTNMFGEIQKNPSNKKGGFIKVPELGKKSGDMETKKLIEEARKTPVYHGTNVEFKDFDPKRINTVESSGDYIGEGFYFTTSKESAKKYAQQAVKKKGGKEVIKEVTLDMKKPFIINSKSDIQKLNDIFGGEDNRIELLLDNPKAVREKLQSLGYDGLIDNLYGQRAVFNAKQIISK